MQRPYLLPAEHRAIPLSSLRPSRGAYRWVPLTGDPAVNLMIDLQRDLVTSVTEDVKLEAALDGMFRLGVRISLVVRDDAVVGVLSLRDAQRSNLAIVEPAGTVKGTRVIDAMVPWDHVPSIDWYTLQQYRIVDLAELFAAGSARYLVVLEQGSSRSEQVRGLIERERLDRHAQRFGP